MAFLKIKDAELYYEEFGEGDRYLLQGQQFVNSYLYYTKDLAEKYGFHVFIIRNRGYAPSTAITEDLGDQYYDVWAQDIVDFADAMGIDRFFYTGHSHGAGIGWHLCMNHPKRLRGFFASACGPHAKDGQRTGEARMATVEAAKSPETWLPYARKMGEFCAESFKEKMIDPIEGENAKRAYEQTVRFFMEMPLVSAALNPGKPFPQYRTEEELIAGMSRITTPILMLGGTEDRISTPELMLRSLRAVPDSQLVLYHGADHMNLCVSYKESYCADIMAFCEARGLL